MNGSRENSNVPIDEVSDNSIQTIKNDEQNDSNQDKNSIIKTSNRETNFFADKEIVDSLRMEYSSVAPQEQERVNKIATEIKDIILEEYGSFIDTETKNNLNDVQNRIIIVDSEGMKKFKEEWLPKALGSGKGNARKEKEGEFFFIGNLIIVKSDRKQIEKIYDKAVKQGVDLYGMGKEKFVSTAIEMNLTETIIHELIHQSEAKINSKATTDMYESLGIFLTQDDEQQAHALESISFEKYNEWLQTRALSECGTSYITRNVMRSRYGTDGVSGVAEVHTNRIEFYDGLVEKYGGIMLHIHFNNVPEGMSERAFLKIRKNILSEFDVNDLAKLKIISEELATDMKKLKTQ